MSVAMDPSVRAAIKDATSPIRDPSTEGWGFKASISKAIPCPMRLPAYQACSGGECFPGALGASNVEADDGARPAGQSIVR